MSSSRSFDVGLDKDIFGSTPPGIEQEDQQDSVNPGMEKPASSEYFVENKVLGVPVCEDDQGLAFRESDDIEDKFEPVSSVHTLVFFSSPGKPVEPEGSQELYDKVLTAARNGKATILSDEHQYDQGLHGFVILLTYSIDEMALKKEFKGAFKKLKDIIAVEASNGSDK